MQLRFLDKNGNEKIRIDRTKYGAKPYLISNNKLQNKYSRYYFKDTLAKSKNQLWYSNIDLNKEKGKIEKPIKPVLRVGTPIFKGEEKVGILIVNIFMEELLSKFSSAALYNIYLIDNEGNYISNPNSDLCWNKYLKNDFNLKNDFFKEYNFILNNDHYKNNKIFSSKLDFNNKDNLKVIIEPKTFYIQEQLSNQLSESIVIMLSIVLLSIPIAYLFASTPIKLKEEILKKDKVINHNNKLAYIDTLTNVYNRNKFDEILNLELKSVKHYNYPLSIALIDIDKFKDFNDTFGHLIGDEVLITMAQTVQNNVRETDTFARWGGEEFIILFKNANISNSKKVSEKIKDKIEQNEHETAGKITASFGLTQYIDGDTIETMFKRCDDALYVAKDNGRNRVEIL